MESDWVSIPIQSVDSHLHPSINPPMDPLWCWRLWSVLWSDKDGGRNTETKATTRARHEGPQKLRRNVSIMQWKMKMGMLNDDAMEVQLQFETTCQATDHAYLMTIPMLTNPGMFWATANIKFNDNKKFRQSEDIVGQSYGQSDRYGWEDPRIFPPPNFLTPVTGDIKTDGPL